MILVKYKFWFIGSEKPEETFTYHNAYPVIGDTICYKNKYFIVKERVFNVNNDAYSIVHCEESDRDTLDEL